MKLTAPKTLTAEQHTEATQYLNERNQRKPVINISAWLANELKDKRITVQ